MKLDHHTEERVRYEHDFTTFNPSTDPTAQIPHIKIWKFYFT